MVWGLRVAHPPPPPPLIGSGPRVALIVTTRLLSYTAQYLNIGHASLRSRTYELKSKWEKNRELKSKWDYVTSHRSPIARRLGCCLVFDVGLHIYTDKYITIATDSKPAPVLQEEELIPLICEWFDNRNELNSSAACDGEFPQPKHETLSLCCPNVGVSPHPLKLFSLFSHIRNKISS